MPDAVNGVATPNDPALSPELEAELSSLLIAQGRLPAPAPPPEPDAGEEDGEDDGEPAEASDEAAPEAEVPAEAVAEAGKPEPETPPEPVEEPAGIARGMASLAKRENKLRQEEATFRQERAQFQSEKAQWDQLKRMAIEDPAGFYKALGVEKTADIGADLFYRQHPEAAPPEFKQKMGQSALEQKLKLLEQREAERVAQMEAQQREASAINYLTAATTTLPDSLGYLKAEAAEDPAGVARMMFHRITQLAQSGSLEQGMSDEEIAALAAQGLNQDIQRSVERMSRLHFKAKTTDPKKPDPVAAEKPKPAPKTLNTKNATATTRPKKAPATRQDEINELIAELTRMDKKS